MKKTVVVLLLALLVLAPAAEAGTLTAPITTTTSLISPIRFGNIYWCPIIVSSPQLIGLVFCR